MSEAGIQTSANKPAAPQASEKLPGLRSLRKSGPIHTAIHALASLRLTVVLFACAIFLVFCGTLAQIDAGVWTIVAKYFRSLYVWIPLQIFFPRTFRVGGGFPFPGGWLIGSLLLVNLIAAHALRFRVGWKRVGIWFIHLGLIVMMVSELITGLMAEERFMRIETGKSTNYIEDGHVIELALADASKPDADDVVVIPAARLRQKGVIHFDDLPFDVEVVRYMVNSDEPKGAPKSGNPVNKGVGRHSAVEEKPEGSGVSSEAREDMPSAHVTFFKKGTSESLGTYLVSTWLPRPQHVQVGDKDYEVALRRKRTYTPYTVHLNKFTHSVYPGTEIPRDYASDVHLVDPSRHAEREVHISMNQPLRYEGETFYQAGVNQSNRGREIGTILQVVRNPGWTMPYISCVMVGLGMIIHFGIHLVAFLRKRATA